MARTSPAPNIPPIPGMCPGVAVLAGNGDGGGGSGGNKKGGKGKKGAGTDDGDEDANGDGANANCAEGSGPAGPCSSCSATPPAGDPVDIASGEVFTPSIVDLFLPGPMNLEIQRKYSSRLADRDVGLGYGWSFTFGWRLVESGRAVTVTDGAGHSVKFKKPSVGQLNEAEGWVLERTAEGYVLGCGTLFVHYFRTLPSAPNRWLLAYVLGPGFNKIVLHYDQHCRLRSITDTAGRVVELPLTSEGRIAAIDVKDPTTSETIRFATYTYDANGDLVACSDADGVTVRYEYGRDHLLTCLRHASGLRYHWVYDGKDRCIETWGDRDDGPDPALSPDLPDVLADGTTRAKGLHHVKLVYDPVGGREVITPLEVQRYFVDENEKVSKAVGNGGVTTRAFDDNGNIAAVTDREGATTTYERDLHGRVLRETDPLGNTIRITRNALGQVLEAVDPAGGVIKFTRDARGFVEMIEDQVGGITQYVWDERGLMKEQIHPNGARSTYAVDAHGNLIEARLCDGAVWRWRYDYWGRMLERVDPLGRSTRYSWTAAGRLAGVQERDGSWFTHDYDAMGDRVRTVRSDGRISEFRYGGVHWLYALVEPNGDTVNYRYDREGRLVSLHNERGEVARFEWNSRGGLTRETTFDGRTIERQYDAVGHLAWEDHGHGKIEYTRDPTGNIVEVTYPDGTSAALSYNARRELVGIKGASSELAFELDARGQVVRERVAIDGTSSSVESAYSTDGMRTRVRTSIGHAEHFVRDALGRATTVVLDEEGRVGFHRDPLGNVMRVALPGGGVIASEYDELRRLSRRRVLTAAQASSTSDEPEYRGAVRGDATVDNAYHFGPFNNLLAERKSDGLIRYEVDARDRLVAKLPERGEPEVFSYDAANNVHLARTGGQEYAPGGQLIAYGGAEYAYDSAGLLVRKTIARGDGGQDVWHYEWNAERMLTAVELPDGARIELDYVPVLRRRLQKRVYALGEDGLTRRLASRTRYVWDQMQLVHEERVSFGDDGRETSRRVRTYVYEEVTSYSPYAEHVTTIAGGARKEEWNFFATDWIGAPEELVHPDGTLAARIERTAYGKTRLRGDATTDVRFPGQFEDEETGLFYNHFRYYDPEIGRYISPDPLGLVGNLNLYLYCTNPVAELDPYGLTMPMDFAVVGPGGASVIPQMGLTSGQSPGFTGPPWNNLRTGHAERKALATMEANPAAMNALRNGGTAHMSAPYPPCNVCHRRMEQWAQNNLQQGGSISYNYPVNQQITYSGSGAQGVPGQPSGALVNAYQNNHVVPNPNVPGTNTTSGSLEYQAQKSAAETAIGANGGTTAGIVLWP